MHPPSLRAKLLPFIIVQRSACLALAFCLLSAQLPALADDDVDEAALGQAETVLFGAAIKDASVEDRLKRAEVRVFGKRKGGSDQDRIDRLVSTLLIERKKQPKDKGDKNDKKDKNNKNDETAKQSDRVETKPAADKVKETELSEDQGKKEEPAETTANEQKSGSETKSQESVPVCSLETKPGEAKPLEMHPEESKPVLSELETKPLESKPVEKLVTPVKQAAKQPGKGVKGGKNARTASWKTAGRGAGAVKSQDIKLTSETAIMDNRNLENPVARSREVGAPSESRSGSNSGASTSNRISRGPQSKVSQATALLREGMEAHRRGDDARAEQLFKKVVLLEPRNPDGYYNLGAVAEKKRDLAGALISYRAALNLSPNDRELHEAVDAVEGMLGMSPSGPHVARGNESSSNHGPESKRHNESQESSQRSQTYNNSSSPAGSYGFGPTAHGPQPAPNFYRARAKTTRELQEQAAPYADVTDPDTAEINVTQGPVPTADVSQPPPIQLQAAQNQAVMGTQRRGHPVASVATRVILGTALSVGTSYALRSSGLHGLHCPICRVTSGGALRGLLRF